MIDRAPPSDVDASPQRAGLPELEASFASLLARLRSGREALRATYTAANPFPHLVLDDVLDPAVLGRVEAEFPQGGQRDWLRWRNPYEDKTTSRGLAGVSPFTQTLFWMLSSSELIDALQQITGTDDLVPDPTFFGAGLQEASRGGWLDIHADYLFHPNLGLARRFNLLLYLNRDWDPAWGGDLELWDARTKQRGQSYAPLFNRLVLFPTTPEALHGHPVPLTCPEDRSRRLLSVYYWSVQPPHAPSDSGLMRRLSARALRVLLRSARGLAWRGPTFYPGLRGEPAPGR